MEKPSDCPKCGGMDVKRIVYGLIEAPSRLREDEYAAGCVVADDSPTWHCGNCDWEWGPEAKGAYNRVENF